MSRHEQWGGFLKNCTQLIHPSSPFLLSGTITRVSGLVMEAVGLKLAVGSSCNIFLSNGHSVSAEVVGFSGERLFLMPSSDVYGLSPGAKVVPAEL
ncbi:MAG: flagellum-specific ATP synthase FliI, partial [Nitrosomonas sp.]